MAVVLVFDALNVTVPLVQVALGLDVAVIFGNWLTVTSAVVIVDVHPVTVLVPVTVYVAFVVGDTVLVFVVTPVGCQLYVSAPVADKVTRLPAQVVALDADTVGNVLTLIVIVSVLLAQLDDSPTIVYVVCVVGVNTMVFVVV